ncbi:MAG TPA: hypothetical protein VNT20_00115 [Flavisolibacter sp.]|jgi:hypothetical protein|nr:hypothetical protein [Flavisolibacter sp.]
MDRAYLLLRNNQQSGPFTIGELLQQQLMPSDMIWIEGKSTAWTYLSELELIPFIEKAETSGQSSLANAGDEIERKAEELRQRILTTPQKSYFQNHKPEIETYASSYKLDDEIQFVDYRKERILKKNTAFAELLLTCLVVGLFMVGIYKGKSFLGARDKVQNSVATELSSGDQHAARKSQEPALAVVPVVDTAKKADSLLALEKAKQKPVKKTVVDSTNTSLGQPINASIINPEKKDESTIQPPPTVSQETAVKKEEDTPARKETVTSVPETKAAKAPAKEEKKGFFRGLFKKKKDKGE